MAPFVWNGEIRHARAVIKDLGDFSAIRSPAKCAARIGQAFSQAFSAVDIPPSAFQRLPEVERIDARGIKRTFSDGVGTCSKSILERIWAAYGQSRAYKPTVCQIRFAGQSKPFPVQREGHAGDDLGEAQDHLLYSFFTTGANAHVNREDRANLA